LSSLSLASCVSIRGGGFLKSQFDLSDESKAPNWLELARNNEREDIMVVLSYYTNSKAIVTVWKNMVLSNFQLNRLGGKVSITRIIGSVRKKIGLPRVTRVM